MKFALIGCGLIGKKRIESLLDLDQEIVGVYDLNKETMQNVSSEYNLTEFESIDHVITAKPDCILVATIHSELYEISKKIITSGINLFIEKPGVVNLHQAKNLYQLALKERVHVGVGFNHRFHPAIVEAKKITDQKQIGKILYIRASYGHGGRLGMQNEWRCDKNLSGGGQLIDQGSHLIDLTSYFLGEINYQFSHINTYFWDTDVEDNVFLALSDKTGAFSWLHASWTEWKNRFTFEIFCEHGKLFITGLGKSYGEEKLLVYKMKPELGPPDYQEFTFPEEDGSWRDEIKCYIDNIEQPRFEGSENNRSNVGSLDDLIQLHQIIDSVYQNNLIEK